MTATIDRPETAQDAGERMREVTIRTATNGLHPEDTYPVPTKEMFEIPDPNRGKDDEPEYHDYLPGDDIARIAATLIGRHGQDFKHLAGAAIVYVWAREGGKNGGKLKFGQCARLDKRARYGLKAEFMIALAADHCRAHRFTARKIEALVYHELLHIGLSDGENPRLTLVPHDFEGFGRELAVYGTWHRDLTIIQRQLSLFDREAGS